MSDGIRKSERRKVPQTYTEIPDEFDDIGFIESKRRKTSNKMNSHVDLMKALLASSIKEEPTEAKDVNLSTNSINKNHATENVKNEEGTQSDSNDDFDFENMIEPSVSFSVDGEDIEGEQSSSNQNNIKETVTEHSNLYETNDGELPNVSKETSSYENEEGESSQNNELDAVFRMQGADDIELSPEALLEMFKKARESNTRSDQTIENKVG